MNRTGTGSCDGKILLDAQGVADKVRFLGAAIQDEFGRKPDHLALVGIRTRGAYLAQRIAALLNAESGAAIPVGILDITLYRDDVHAIADQPEVKETELPFDLEDRPIVLIDDVLFTGRTVRSAMNALIDYGRPDCIRLGVLIDRGHHELPIGADYTGILIRTNKTDVVDVNLSEIDGEDSIRIRQKVKS